jgi:hypothetical protein
MTQAVNLSAIGSYGGVLLPSWTTAARPTPAYTGQQGYNTTLGTAEFYNGTTWVQTTITSSTAQASTSGTSIDFTSIPSWVKRITVMFNGISTNGTSPPQIQIGSGSITTSGYKTQAAYISGSSAFADVYSTGFVFLNSTAAVYAYSGAVTLTLIGSNTWCGTGTLSLNTSTSAIFMSSGVSPALSGTLDRVRITTVNGTDAFDAGTINILYE